MTMTITTDEALFVLLVSLGSTADEIADKLRAAGIKGSHGMDCCPIANWLKREVGLTDWDEIEVDALSVYLCRHEQESLVVNPPTPVVEFVCRFDDEGEYLDLEEVP